MDKTKIMMIGIIAIAAAVLVFAVYSFMQTQYYGDNYKKAMQSQLSDKCATPPGYTDEQWREHMGHHPDQYKECLN